MRMGHCCVARYYGTVVGTLLLLLRSCAGNWVSVVPNCTMGLFLEHYRFFYWLFMRARLGQCCVKLHYGTVFGTLSLLFKFKSEFNNTLSC